CKRRYKYRAAAPRDAEALHREMESPGPASKRSAPADDHSPGAKAPPPPGGVWIRSVAGKSCAARHTRGALQFAPRDEGALERAEDRFPNHPGEQRAVKETHRNDEQRLAHALFIHPASERGEEKLEADHDGEPGPNPRRMADKDGVEQDE